jgi:hypothetical protein
MSDSWINPALDSCTAVRNVSDIYQPHRIRTLPFTPAAMVVDLAYVLAVYGISEAAP